MSLLYQLLGWTLILIGLPLTLSPLPFGIILVAIGLALIMANSRSARRHLQHLRAQHKCLDEWMRKAESTVPGPFDRILRQTDTNGWQRPRD
ncbi:hypothetical protein [Hyphobacterium sp.]|jgi:hypothetical protein|uniref:hypothetical protein n=1 Tax=Hyphobacterium sp. TaxID=2004662 RepID=UPI003BA91980